MLGIADEDGWVQILDTRKRGQKSIVKGSVYKATFRKNYLIFCQIHTLVLFCFLRKYFIPRCNDYLFLYRMACPRECCIWYRVDGGRTDAGKVWKKARNHSVKALFWLHWRQDKFYLGAPIGRSLPFSFTNWGLTDWLTLQVTASGDQTIRLWDVNRDDCLALFKGHSCSVKSVDFREDDICKFCCFVGECRSPEVCTTIFNNYWLTMSNKQGTKIMQVVNEIAGESYQVYKQDTIFIVSGHAGEFLT